MTVFLLYHWNQLILVDVQVHQNALFFSMFKAFVSLETIILFILIYLALQKTTFQRECRVIVHGWKNLIPYSGLIELSKLGYSKSTTRALNYGVWRSPRMFTLILVSQFQFSQYSNVSFHGVISQYPNFKFQYPTFLSDIPIWCSGALMTLALVRQWYQIQSLIPPFWGAADGPAMTWVSAFFFG